MPRRRTVAALPIIAVLLVVGLLLPISNPGLSQTVQAQQDIPIFDIHTEMVPSNWPLIPSGLGPGDSFRLMFVTIGVTDGTTNSIHRYNDFVRNEAKKNTEIKLNMRALFTALVSVYQGIDARGNTRTQQGDPGDSSPIYWMYGEKVADNYADFYDGSWDSRAGRTADGGYVIGNDHTVHTGSTHQGTPATYVNWSLALGSPHAWWALGTRQGAYGDIAEMWKGSPGYEIYLNYGPSAELRKLYGISPVFKVRSATGPKPIISGPTGTVTGPFDVTITFPDDYLVIGMKQDDIKISGGSLSNFRHTAGAGTATGDKADETGTVYTVTVTPNYAPSIYDPTTVSLSIGAGAVTDTNEWSSVASDTYTVKSSRMNKVAVTISFDDSGVGTVPRSWAYIPSADVKPGDSFRLLFVTSDTRDANSGNIGDYNGFVQRAAGRNSLLSGFGGRFRVLASTYGVHAIDNSGTRGTGVPIYWLESAKAADNYPDFYDGSWDSRAGTDEQGTRLSGSTQIWTGTRSDGTEAPAELGSRYWNVLYATLGMNNTFGNSETSSDDGKHLYALSPVLKVAKPGGL